MVKPSRLSISQATTESEEVGGEGVDNRLQAGPDIYLIIIVLLLPALPAGSVIAETAWLNGNTNPLLLIGKWYVLWAVGVRFFTAGARQMLQPQFTADIFAIKDSPAHAIVC
jgi:hypothetical protein